MENVVIEIHSGASVFVRKGWANALRSIGYNVVEWNPEQRAANDVFDTLNDVKIFLSCTYSINRSLEKIIRKRPNMKVGLFGSAFGPVVKEIDLQKYPIVVINDNEKHTIEALKDRISFVHIHVSPKYLDYVMGWWNSIGVKPVSIMNAADLFTYYKNTPETKYFSDVSFVGGRWPYKSATLDNYIGNLCYKNWNKLNIKIWGSGGWECTQYLGMLPFGEDAKVFPSAKVCPNISEAHSYIFGDVIERIFKVPAAGGFLISDHVDLTGVYDKDVVPQFSSYQEFEELIYYWTDRKNDAAKAELQKKQQINILKNHTYFERVAQMLLEFNMSDKVVELLKKKREIFGDDL